MPLNQNKSLTPGGKSRGEKTTTTDNSESSNVLIWRSLRVYSGRSCRTETTAGANRIRLRKRERKREKERRKKESSKQKKKKRNETNGVGKEKKKKISFLSSINLTPFWATPYSSARITLCLVLFFFFFPEKNKNKNESTPFIIIKYESRALQSRAHNRVFSSCCCW